VLGRDPDAEGLAHYRAALERGRPRLQVLWTLRASPEGRDRELSVPGLDEALRALQPQRPALLERFVPGRATELLQVARYDLGRLSDRLRLAETRLQQGLQALQTELRARAEADAMRLRDEHRAALQAASIAAELSRFEWPPETDLWRIAEDCVSLGERGFVARLFRVGLERDPSPAEWAHFAARMAEGCSRRMLVDKLLQSAEFLARHPLAGHAAAAASTEPPPPLPSIPIHARPEVTVVIPVFGKLRFTLQCLRSIATHPPTVPFEVIVVDDASQDDSAEVLARVPGIRLMRNRNNEGFIRSCNHGAWAARGQYVCLLNNDTEVHAGWLDALRATFDLFPGTGLAGSKLVYPDGTLQEAGGILWRDGSAWNFGRGQDASLPCFNYAREVDYCSGASVMIPIDEYRRFGGLDEHYLPAYCEDSDFALKLRKHGLRVIYQPASVVTHHEGVTSGTDIGSGTKAYQVANTAKLYERWKEVLAARPPNGEDVDRAKDRAATRRVLVIDHVTATPDQDAGSVTVVNTLTLLREMRLQVTYIPQDNFLFMPDYTVALQSAGVEALYAPHVTSVEQHLLDQGARYDLVLMWRPQVVERHLETVRRLCPGAPVIYHTVDLHYLRMEREAAMRADRQLAAAAERMKAVELHAVSEVDCAIVHSTHEREVLLAEGAPDKLFVFPLIIDVPGSERGFEARSGIAFVGGFQHPPNVDAVLHFVADVMPLLRRRVPGLCLHVIGSKAPPEVLALAADDIVIEGFVPELRPLLERMRLSVAPLRYGAGIKGKIGNSMAMGLPVVATRTAVEGMQLVEGHEVLVADEPPAMADAIVAAYEDKNLWLRLQAAGQARIDALSGPQASYRTLARLLDGLGIKVDPPAHPLRLYRDDVAARR
jgi:O-antigen biosynthesis protein